VVVEVKIIVEQEFVVLLMMAQEVLVVIHQVKVFGLEVFTMEIISQIKVLDFHLDMENQPNFQVVFIQMVFKHP
jgi:hypothetical protein